MEEYLFTLKIITVPFTLSLLVVICCICNFCSLLLLQNKEGLSTLFGPIPVKLPHFDFEVNYLSYSTFRFRFYSSISHFSICNEKMVF